MIIRIKKRYMGPAYRKTIKPLIKKYKVSKISNNITKDSNFSNIRIGGICEVCEQSQRDGLIRALEHLKRFCDIIVVYGNVGENLQIISQYTKHVVELNEYGPDYETKLKQLSNLISSLNLNWIVWLDSNRVFDRYGESDGIRELCINGDRQGIDGFLFREFIIWENFDKYRADGQWNDQWQIRLWKNKGNLIFEKKGRGYHKSTSDLKKTSKSSIKVINFEFYPENLPNGKGNVDLKNNSHYSDLDSGRDGGRNEIKLKPFSRDWLPISVMKVTVVCPVYRSSAYVNFVFNAFKKYTTGIGYNVDFLFVANDPTDKLLNYLKENNFPFVLFRNKDPNEYYINRVYRAFNYGGFNAKGDIIVLINSDASVAEKWLDNLLKHLREDRILTSRVVEPGKLKQATYAIKMNFGYNYLEFDDKSFQEFVKKISVNKIVKGEGDFMPCAIYKDVFVKVGGFPEGNRIEKDGAVTPGDRIFFYEILRSRGITHYTVCDSLVYHIQSGEMDD